MEKNMENEMESGIIQGLYWDYIGIMENKMETTISKDLCIPLFRAQK